MESSNGAGVYSSHQNRTLVIMAKAPRSGTVKTRLTQSLPLPAVTALYCCLLQDTMALAQSLRGVRVALMCPAQDAEELAVLLGNVTHIVAQKGQGLAAGLTSVFAHFKPTDRHHVIAFNSDSPHLPAAILESAFQRLAAHDVVIGPTHDGGYYLIGARAPHPTLFENDGMGTRSALEALLARTRLLDLSTDFTDPFYDIDVADDLIRLAAELRFAPERAPRTAAWFLEWGEAFAALCPPSGTP
jgi:rSAM/selenodomain-associated transferase 1